MIDSTPGVQSKSSVTEATRNRSSTTRQATSDAFQALFANSVASAPKLQAKAAVVSNRKPAPLRTSQSETTRVPTPGGASTGARSLLAIDVTKPSAQTARPTATSLVAIPMNQPVAPPASDTTPFAADEPTVDDQISSLIQAMKEIGIDTSKLTIAPRDLTNWCPSGSWVDHEFQVSTQDGKSVYLAQDLLKGNYTIGACDVQHMLDSPYA
jgi:hypothetical protein